MAYGRDKTALQLWHEKIQAGMDKEKAGEITAKVVLEGVKTHGERLGMTEHSIEVKLDHLTRQLEERSQIRKKNSGGA